MLVCSLLSSGTLPWNHVSGQLLAHLCSRPAHAHHRERLTLSFPKHSTHSTHTSHTSSNLPAFQRLTNLLNILRDSSEFMSLKVRSCCMARQQADNEHITAVENYACASEERLCMAFTFSVNHFLNSVLLLK